MTTPQVPKWAKEQREHERTDNRAARVAALYILSKNNGLPNIPKTHLAKILGISRWTLDRDLSSIEEVSAHVESILTNYGTTLPNTWTTEEVAELLRKLEDIDELRNQTTNFR